MGRSDSGPVQAIVFDLDGLMVDSEPLAEWAWSRALANLGVELDHQTFNDVLGMRVIDSARLICERYSLPLSPAEAMAERDRLFLAAVPERLRPRPGLGELLDDLESRGVARAIATSGHGEYVALVLETLGLADRFHAVARGDEVRRGKPAPDIYRLAADRLGAVPQRCIALEDAPLGVQSACAAGMVCWAVPNGRTTSLSFPGAQRTFVSLLDVRDGLDKWLEPGAAALHGMSLKRYVAAGGIVVRGDRVLVLRRPSRNEVRLPKGHVEPDETLRSAALREVEEESGCTHLTILTDLGAQMVEFQTGGKHVIRVERYFLMTPEQIDPGDGPLAGEAQFTPVWLPWQDALTELTFDVEREWVRRARQAGTY